MSNGTVYRLGMWNPAGAQTKEFKTREERDKARTELSQTGWTVWEVASGPSAS